MSLPQGTVIVTDDQARLMVYDSVLQPNQSQTLYDTALDLIGSWSDRHSARIVEIVWGFMEPGSILYLRPDFLATPPVAAESEEIEGYKQYIKE